MGNFAYLTRSWQMGMLLNVSDSIHCQSEVTDSRKTDVMVNWSDNMDFQMQFKEKDLTMRGNMRWWGQSKNLLRLSDIGLTQATNG